MHSAADFTEHMLGLLKTTGTSGPTGPSTSNVFNTKEKTGTTREHVAGPVAKDWSQAALPSGPSFRKQYQSVATPVTSGTSGTTTFAGGAAADHATPAPAEWVAVLAELKRLDPAGWLSGDRWRETISDAEDFQTAWGNAAQQLDWKTFDLFGVHPLAPAARLDAMGLVFLIQGGEVVALTEQTATIRRLTGSILTYRRHNNPGAVLISKVVA